MNVKQHELYDETQETVILMIRDKDDIKILLKRQEARVFRNKEHALKYARRHIHAAFKDHLFLDNYGCVGRNL